MNHLSDLLPAESVPQLPNTVSSQPKSGNSEILTGQHEELMLLIVLFCCTNLTNK